MTHEKNMIDYLDWLEDADFSDRKDEYPGTMEEARKFRHSICQKDFLKSPPKLGDFVPTNEKGEVMEEPEPEGFNDEEQEPFYNQEEVDEYRKALDRVLWKGWEIGKTTFVDRKGFESKCLHVEKDKNILSWEFDKKQMTLLKGNTFYQKNTYNELITSGVKLERIQRK